jgi:hypothetical protein
MGEPWKEQVAKAREKWEGRGNAIVRPENHVCMYCRASLLDLHPAARFCSPCFIKRSTLQHRAAHVVLRAVRSGAIPEAKTLACVDCGKPAQCWDHRDYDKPMHIEPVCRGCNKARGPALAPSITRSQAA